MALLSFADGTGRMARPLQEHNWKSQHCGQHRIQSVATTYIYIYIYITLDCSTQPPLDVIFLQLHVNSIASRELLQTNDRKSWTGICVGQEALEIAKHLIIHNPKLRWLIENLPVLWGVSPVTECPIEYLLMIADVELVIGKGQARKQLRHVKQLTTWLYNPNTCHVCVNGKHITTLPAWRGVSNLE